MRTSAGPGKTRALWLFLSLALTPVSSEGADIIWSYGGVSPLASDNANWLGGVAPSTGDYVVFGNFTPAAPCTWDLNLTLSSMTITGAYASTVTLATELTISSGVVLDAGISAQLDINGRKMWVQGDWLVGNMKTTSSVAGSSVTFYGAGVTKIKRTTGGPAQFNYLVINKDETPSVEERLYSDIEVFGDFTVLTGSHTSGPNVQYLRRDFILTDGYFDSQISTLIFSGSLAQKTLVNGEADGTAIGALFVQNPVSMTLSPPLSMSVLVATQPGTTLIFNSGGISIGSMTINGGSASGRIMVLSASQGTSAAVNVTVYSSASYTYVRDINSGGGLAVTAQTSVNAGNNTNWTFPGGDGRTTRYWKYGGSSNLASGAGNWVSGKPGAADYVVFGSTSPGDPCTWDLDIPVSSLSVTGAYGSTVTFLTDMTVSSDVLVDAGAGAILDLNGRHLQVQGDWIAGDMRTTSTVAGSSVTFYGAGVSKVKRKTAGPAQFNNLVIKKNPAGGVQELLLSDLEVFDNFTLMTGSHTAGSNVQYLHRDFYLVTGYADMNVSTVIYAGNAPQRTAILGEGGGNSFGAVFVYNPSTVHLSATPIGVFVATQPATKLTVPVGGFGLMVGSMTIDGLGSSGRIQVVSAGEGVAAVIYTTVYSSVSYVYTRDLDSSGGLAVTALTSVDAGNNTNWTFPGGDGRTTRFWQYGGASNLASDAGNWAGGKPGAADFVVFGNNTPGDPCSWDLDIPVSSLTVTGTYGSTVTFQVDMLVSSDVRVDAGAGAILDINGYHLRVQGDWLAGDMRTTSTVEGSSVTFYGAGTSKIKRLTAGPVRFNNLVIKKNPAGGVEERLYSDLEVNGNFTILTGSHTAGANTQHLRRDFFFSGGFLDASISTVVYSGNASQRTVIAGGGGTSGIGSLFVQNPSSVTLGPIPASILVATRADSSLVFDTLATAMSVDSATINGQGAGTRLRLRSIQPGTQAKFVIGVYSGIEFVNVADIDSSGGLPIVATKSDNFGNNLNWTFPISGDITPSSFTLISSTSFTAYWDSTFPMSVQYFSRVSSGPWENSFAGNVSSDTANLFAGFSGLEGNTTYYLKVGTGASGPFTILTATPTLSTLAVAPTIYAVYGGSVTANWNPLPASPSSTTAEGYRLEASTASDFTGTVLSSVTRNVSLSTLTVFGLDGSTTYYLRVGSLGWGDNPNFLSIGSTITTAGLPPGCEASFDVGKSGWPYPTIQSGVNAAGASLSADTCIVVRDNAVYSERVTVQNITMNNNRLRIFTDLNLSSGATVNPPKNSTAAFNVLNDSVTIQFMNIITTNSVPYGIRASSAYMTVAAVNVDGGGSVYAAGIAISSWTTVTVASITARGAAHGLWLDGNKNAVSYATATSANIGTSGIYVLGADSNTFTVLLASSNLGVGLTLGDGANGNQISLSTIASNAPALPALWINLSSSNTISTSYINGEDDSGVLIDGGAQYNTVSQSTIAGNDGNRALDIRAAYNTVTQSFVTNLGTGGAGFIGPAGPFNTISLSTFTCNNSTAAFYVTQATGTSLSRIFAYNPTGEAIQIDGNAHKTSIAQSTAIGGAAGGAGLVLNWVSSISVTGSVLRNPNGMGAKLSNVLHSTISYSTMTSDAANYPALYLHRVASTTVGWSYIQGSTGVFIAGSTSTAVNSSVLVATNTFGHGLSFSSVAGVNFGMSSNTVIAGGGGAGIYLGGRNLGLLNISTNTIRPGPPVGIFVSTQGAGASVVLASNTVLMSAGSAVNSYGILINGLTTGATIQNNGIFYRGSGAAASTYGLYARSAQGLLIDHNRIGQPGALTGGNFSGAYFAGVTVAEFKFNDLHAAGAGLATAYLLELSGSTVSVRNNVFLSSLSVTGSSATYFANRWSGVDSNYNDFFSSNSFNTGVWGAASAQFPAGWTTLTGKDANSTVLHPIWHDPAAGTEDYHPRSMRGRYSVAAQGFVGDGVNSPLIDAADPAEGVGLEPAPNGGLPNQGSYGLTAEASKPSPAPASPVVTTAFETSVTLGYGTVSFSDGYSAEADLTAGFSSPFVDATGNPLTSSLTPGGLAPNTTYFFRVGARYGLNNNYAVTTPASTSTLTNPPVSPYQNLFLSSGSLTWGANSNPADTIYLAQVSTDSFATIVASSRTLYLSATIQALLPNTTYQFRVRAINRNSVGSAFATAAAYSTLAEPALNGVIFAVYYSSVTANWQFRPPAPPDASSMTAEGYLLQASTAADFTGIILSSANTVVSQSTLTVFGLGGATYYFRLGAKNWNSTPHFVAIGSTRTTKNLPFGCGDGLIVKADGTQDSATIQGAIDALPAFFNTEICVVIRDDMTYNEQVTIRNFSNNSYKLRIMADPSFVSTAPAVNPPASSTAAFRIMNASVTIEHVLVQPTNPIPYGIIISSADVLLSSVSVDSGGRIFLAGVVAGTRTLVTASSVTVQAADAYVLDGASATVILSSGAANDSNFAALHGWGAASVTVTRSMLTNPGGRGVYLEGGFGARIDQSSISSNASGYAALHLAGASYATITRTPLYNAPGWAARLAAKSHHNSITQSSMTVDNGSTALFIEDSSSNTVSQAFITNPSGHGAWLVSSSHYNTLSQSTAAAGSFHGLYVAWSSYNVVTQSYLQTSGGNAAYFDSGGNFNSLSASTAAALCADCAAARFFEASTNTVTGSVFWSPAGWGTIFEFSNYNTLSQSTVATAGAVGVAVRVSSSAGVRIWGNHIEGSTAAAISGSTGTVLESNVLVALGASGRGVSLDFANIGLSMSSNTVTGGPAGAGLDLGLYNAGLIMVSSNTFRSGAQFGVLAGTQAAGATVWLTSNTVFPALSAVRDTYGIFLEGLVTGANIQNNGIYWRGPGSMGAFTTYGLRARSSSGLVVERNRFSEPEIVTGGSIIAVDFEDADASNFKFNDIHVSGTGLTDAFLLRLKGSSDVTVKNNVFLSSLSVAGSSATLSVSEDSQSGFTSDYNDFFSSNSLNTGLWGGSARDLPGAWFSTTGKDPNSIAVHPLWAAPYAGIEDYHPRSMRGRWDPAAQGFLLDAATSRSIDGGDPGEPSAIEPDPDGARVNQGSYGGTLEASKSAPPPGSPSLAGVFTSSVAVGYSAVASDGYSVDASLSPDFSAPVSSAAPNSAVVELSPQGLSPNTTYFLRAGAIYGANTNFSLTIFTTATLAALPGAPVPGESNLSSATLSWGAAGNPAGTMYEAQASLDNFSTVLVTSRTLMTSATFTALALNTTHFLRVRAVNHNSVPTLYSIAAATATLADIPGGALAALFYSSGNITYGSAGNPAGTTYYAEISTDGFATLNASSRTLNLSATFFSLALNTTHYLRVKAEGINRGTAFTGPGGLAGNVENPGAAAFGEIHLSSAGLVWSSNGNPAGTLWEAQVSTDNFSTMIASSRTLNLSATFFSLLSNATHYLRVRAQGHNGGLSNFSTLTATATAAALPVSLPPTGVAATEARANWLANGNGSPTLYEARISTDGFGTLVNSSRTQNVFADFPNLTPNTAYVFEVRALGNNGTATSFTSLPSTTTLITAPGTASPAFLAVRLSSVTAQWSDGGNGPGTTYAAEVSTDGFATVNFASSTLNLTAYFGTGGAGEPLLVNTTHAFRVRVVNGPLVSAYVSIGSTATLALALAPGAAAFGQVAASSFSLAWPAGGNPSGTVYEAQASLDDFATVLVTSRTLMTSATFTSLSPATTHYARVRAVNHNEVPTPFTATLSTVTKIGPPADPFASVYLASAAVSWGTGGNPAGTTYYAEISTDAFVTVNASSRTLGLAATYFSLAVNTTHYMRVRAEGAGGLSSFVSPPDAATGADVPVGAVFGAVHLSSAGFVWTANGNPASTAWEVQISTDNFSTLIASSRTLNLSATFFSLLSNATHYLRVRAQGHNGLPSAFSAPATTATVAALPGSSPPSGVTAAAVRANWLVNGNGSPTLYEAQVSTDAFATLVNSSRTQNPFADFGNLTPNTAYVFQVRALGHNAAATNFTALPSTTTLLTPPGTASPAFASVQLSSVTARWSDGGNGPGTTYAAEVSTDGFATVNFASSTLNLTAYFGTGGAGEPLLVNTTHAFRVRVVNGPLVSAYVSIGSTGTLAFSPASPALGQVAVSSLSLVWSANGNPSGTVYAAEISTDDFATVTFTSRTLMTSATFTSLPPATTHYARVRAVNPNEVPTPFTATLSTVTTTGPPANPFASVYLTSAAVSWGAAGNPAGTTYYAEVSTDGFATVNSSSRTLNLSATFFNLAVNTTQYLRVRVEGPGGNGPFVSPPDAATDAYDPAGGVFAGVHLSSAGLGWLANANPASTLWEAQVSTDNFTTVNESSRTLNLSATFFSLLSNTTHYLRVRTQGHNGGLSNFSTLAATATLAAPPGSSPPSGVAATAARANWLANGNGTPTLYEAQLSTDSFATLVNSSRTQNAYADFSNLTPNTAYVFQARALGHNAKATNFTALPSTTTLLLPPGTASPAFSAVQLSSATAQWSDGGNAPGTTYTAEVSTDGFATVNFASSTLNLTAFFGTGGAGQPLPVNTTHNFRVRVVNGPLVSAYVTIGSTATLAALPASPIPGGVNRSSAALTWGAAGNPAGTVYEAQASLDNFSTVLVTSRTLMTSATFTALARNTTHFLRVAAVNHNSVPTLYSIAAATATLAEVPGGALAALFYSSGNITYGAAGNPAGTTYYAEISTDSFATINASSRTLNLSATFFSLAANTTHYLRVRADGLSRATAFAGPGALANNANDPAGAVFGSVHLSSAGLVWSANGNPAQTMWEAQVSTDNFSTLTFSSRTLNLSATFFSLLSNATHYLRVRAQGHNGGFSSFAALTATATAAALPGSSPPTGVAATAARANWLANGNGSPTLYEAQASTDAFATLVNSSRTQNAYADFSNLTANTAYVFQVRALGHNAVATQFTALPSTTTLLLPPGTASPAFLAVQLSSVTAQWSDGGNGPGTAYAAEVSTDGFATVNFASSTLNLSAYFGTGGAGQPLLVNATHSFRVRVVNGPLASAYVSIGSTATLAFAPASAAFGQVVLSSISLAWTAAGNPAGTVYEAQASLDNFSTVLVTSRTLMTSATFTALAQNTTHYLRVRAVNHNSLPTLYSASAATATLAADPGGAAAALFYSSGNITYQASGNPAGTTYYAEISTDNFTTLNASSRTLNLSATFFALTANTTHYLRVRAEGLSRATAFAGPGALANNANDPAGAVFGEVHLSSAGLAWPANGNPSQTMWEAQVSTDNFATLIVSSRTLNLSATFFGLLSNATHYLRVRAQGHNGSPSGFSTLTATATLTALPGSAVPSGVTGTAARANWLANGNGSPTLYEARISTDAFLTLVNSSRTQNAFADFANLTPNTAYVFQVRALGHNGLSTAYVALPSTTTLLLPPGTASPAFQSVQLSSVTARWSDGGNGPATVYEAQLSTDGFATVNFSSSTLNLSASFGTGGAGQPLLVNTTHQFRVRVVNGPLVSAYLTIGSTATLVFAPASPALGTVAISSISLSWAANGNPAGTLFVAQISTDNFATVTFASRTLMTSATFTSLVPATTHYLRVRALNHNSVASLFTAILASVTYSGVPSNPFSSVYLTSAAVSWGTAGNPAGTTYYAEISTDAFGTVNASSRTLAAAATFFNLTANTTHFLRVRSEGAGGASAFVTAAGAATAANDIAAAYVNSVELSSAGFSWTANNPPGTTYYAQLSTDSFATVSLASAPVGPSATFYGLAANSTYYFRVRAVNHGGLFTVYAVLTGTATNAAAPTSASASDLTSTNIRANWGAGGNASPTLYEARLSTDAFSTLVNSSRTQNAFADFSNLTPNTAYALQVRALGHNGEATAYTELPSTSTYLLPPSTATPAFPLVEAASATVQWTSGGNGPGTNYIVEASTDSFGTVNFASTTLNLTAFFGASGAGQPLRSNATHYFRVRTTNGPNFSGYVSLGSTLTLAAIPGSPVGVSTFTPAGAAAFTLNWASGTVAGGYNSVTTLYRAEISQDSGFSPVDDSSQTYNLSAAFGGLSANRTYFARVRAFGGTGKNSPYLALGSTATATSPPGIGSGSAFSAVAETSFAAGWTANGNNAGTTYYAQISLNAGFATVAAASETLNLSAVFGGLFVNTTYYARAAAYSISAGTWTSYTVLGSTATLANPPVAIAAGGVHLSSAGLVWSANANPAGTRFEAEISTDSFGTLVASSRTLNASATFFGLLSNGAYSMRVRAVSHGQVPAAYSLTVASTTLTAVPVAAPASGFGVSSITANWSANGNFPGTLYEARVSTDDFLTFNAAILTNDTGAAFPGLAGNTTHYFIVRALGSRNTTPFTVLPATMTLLQPPEAAAIPFSSVGVGSVTVLWANGGNGPGTEYNVQVSSDAFGTLNLSSRTANLTALFGAGGAGASLQPNTTHTFRAQTINNNNASAFVGLGSTITLAMPPAGLASSNVRSTSATLSWSLNGNPVWTAAEVERSTDNIGYVMVSSGAAASSIERGLLGCTAYYFRVRNRNASGLPTSYDGPVQFTTEAGTPLPPAGLSALSLGGNRIELSWVTSPSPGIVNYRLYYDAGTGVVNYASPVAVLTSTETLYTTGVLASSAAYRFGLRASNNCGVEESNTSVLALAASTTTVSAVRAALSAPASGLKVKGDSLSLVASLAAGSPSEVSQVLFQYRAAGGGTWASVAAADASHPNPDPVAPYAIHWNVNALAQGTYEVRAVASDSSGGPDSSPSAVSLEAVGAAAAVFDINENAASSGGEPVIQKIQLLQNGTTSTVQLSDDVVGSLITVVLPVGALSSDSALLTGVMNPALPAPPPDGLTSIGQVLELTLGNGQTQLSGGKTAELTFSYEDANNDDFLDGTELKTENLKIYSFGGGVWNADVATTIDKANRRIVGLTSHFSFFAVFGTAAAADLSQIRVYPNPYKPNGGDPNQGKPFDAADPTSGIVFKNVPTEVRIRIYTLTGQLVAQFGRERGPASLQWDVKNDNGQNVATGAYIAVIASPRLKTAVKKIAIIR